MTLLVTIDGWENGVAIPERFAFCQPAQEGHVTLGANRSPGIAWSEAPAGTASFAIICHDPDVPSVGDDVNQEGRTIPADLPRVDFYHWVLVDIPANLSELAEGTDSDGVTAGGKPPGTTDHGTRGINNYTDWFAGDADMKGEYGGYDGPCPPWNDTLIAPLPLHRLRPGCGDTRPHRHLWRRRGACFHGGARAGRSRMDRHLYS